MSKPKKKHWPSGSRSPRTYKVNGRYDVRWVDRPICGTKRKRDTDDGCFVDDPAREFAFTPFLYDVTCGRCRNTIRYKKRCRDAASSAMLQALKLLVAYREQVGIPDFAWPTIENAIAEAEGRWEDLPELGDA